VPIVIYGVNAVAEAVRAGRVRRMAIVPRAGKRLADLSALARREGVAIEEATDDALARWAPGGGHQGVVAWLCDPPARDLASVLGTLPAGRAPLVVVLDGIEDPQNLGAILRVAEGAGATAVVRQTRRAAPLGGAAAKASAGAVAHVPVVDVVNVARALEDLARLQVWTVGLDGGAPLDYDQVDLTLPTALVLGAEGAGLRRLVRERCDVLARIPMQGRLESLNVATAAAVVLFEAVRQRKSSRAKSSQENA
jgi:23S rRNA (guanosine2251-2'-O)-methyltransferase